MGRPHPEIRMPDGAAALAFAAFLLGKNQGQAIMSRNGQPSVVPSKVENFDKVPSQLKAYVKK